MSAVLRAMAGALRDLREPRMLALALLPAAAALALWAALAWAFAPDWARWVGEAAAGAAWLGWLRDLGLSSIAAWAAAIAVVALLLPLMLIAALLVTEIVAMPVVVPWVAARHYPGLERRRGGTALGAAANAARETLAFAALWLVTLPLWLTGVGALLLPPLLAAHYNQRMLRYDALAEHASAEEFRAVVRGTAGRLYLLGLALALLYYVPLVNLAVPLLSALAFTHFCLGELARLRRIAR
ncbi:MAG TPA: EI24 domain-containing protein [Burkholderiales bacterium]|nr:EI24 domain-containing protein [Burkholderiales bacterium]